MSSVKISGLSASSNLNVNPAQSIFPTVDSVTGQTTKISGKALGTSLYANNTLIVGTGGVTLPNTLAQFTGNTIFAGGYVQVNEQNLSNTGSADYIVTADTGTDLNYYIDMGITNSQYSNTSPYNGLSTSIEPLSGYLYVQGNYANNAQGNLVIGTVNAGTETRFIAGGSKTANVIYKVTSSGINILNNKSLIFSDGSTQITAGVPAAYAQAAYAQANVTIGVDATQNTRLTVIEGTDVSQNVRLDYSNTAITIIQGVDVSQNARMTIIEGVDVTQNTNILATDGKMQSAYNTANNALANTTGTFAGTLTITGTVGPQKGFIYTPLVYPSAQTAITIDIANDSVVRAQTAAGLVVTLSSFVAGKVVEAWITNTAGTNQTFTHGVSAINSTVNSTTYAIPSTSSIFVKYWCMDGTLANTFVAITK